MLPFSEDEHLVFTSTDGLFLYSDQRLQPFETELDEFWASSQPFMGESIYEKYFAIGTQLGGLIIIDQQGKLIQRIDKAMGLPEGDIWDLLLDREGNLWVATWSGIAQIMLHTPFTEIDERHGLETKGVNHIGRGKNTTYVATNFAIYEKPDSRPWQSFGDNKPFRKVPNSEDGASIFLVDGEDLISASTAGITWIKEKRKTNLYSGESLWTGTMLEGSEKAVFSSYEGHLHLVEKKNGVWKSVKTLEGFSNQIDYIMEQEDGSLWVVDNNAGVFRLVLSKEKDEILLIKQYDKDDGLPSTVGIGVLWLDESFELTTSQGILSYQKSSDRFEPNDGLNKALDYSEINSGSEFTERYTFVSGELGIGLLVADEQGTQFQNTPFQRIEELSFRDVIPFNRELWLRGDYIIHFDPDLPYPKDQIYHAFIRQAIEISKDDSLL